MEARTDAFGSNAGGAAFNAYSYGAEMQCRAYAVRAGDTLRDELPIAGTFVWRIDGANGFMRQFAGTPSDTITARVDYEGRHAASGKLEIRLSNHGAATQDVTISDVSYGHPVQRIAVAGGGNSSAVIDTTKAHGWYDFTVRAGDMTSRYAGRVETGKWSITDPAMGHG
jgi:phospholipase C